jgi:hypothetical protein
LVRTLPCHGRGREFESRRPRHSFQGLADLAFLQPTRDSTRGRFRRETRGEVPGIFNRVDVFRRGLLTGVAQHSLNQRRMDIVCAKERGQSVAQIVPTKRDLSPLLITPAVTAAGRRYCLPHVDAALGTRPFSRKEARSKQATAIIPFEAARGPFARSMRKCSVVELGGNSGCRGQFSVSSVCLAIAFCGSSRNSDSSTPLAFSRSFKTTYRRARFR